MDTITLNNIFQVATEAMSKAAKRRKRKRLKNQKTAPDKTKNPFGAAKGTNNISGQGKHIDKTKYRRKNKYNKINEGGLHNKVKSFIKLGV